MVPTYVLIATNKGNPTVTKYFGAAVFVNIYSDFTYVCLIPKLDAEDKVEAKLEFEIICDSYGVIVLHYHADNGLFATKTFKESCNTAKKNLKFCEDNAHNQNGTLRTEIKM